MSLALKCGALDLSDVVSWADKSIIEAEFPDERLFEVSLSKNIYDAVSALQSFGEHENSGEVARRAFSYFLDGLMQQKTTYSAVTKMVYDMAFSGLKPSDEVEGKMMVFWDELSDAELGVYGEPIEVKKEFLQFLKKYGS